LSRRLYVVKVSENAESKHAFIFHPHIELCDADDTKELISNINAENSRSTSIIISARVVGTLL